MSYKITVLKNDIQKVKNYNVAEVAYKTDDGKVKGMKVLDFVQKDVFATLKDVQPGDVLDADFEKNAKGFWQFAQLVKTGVKADTAVAAQSASSSSPTANQANTASRGNWETSDERAKRQVMIVRQSSLSNAIAFSDMIGNKKADLQDIVAIAKVFEGYVLDLPVQTGEVE